MPPVGKTHLAGMAHHCIHLKGSSERQPAVARGRETPEEWGEWQAAVHCYRFRQKLSQDTIFIDLTL